MVVGDRRLERMVGIFTPVGKQAVDADGIDNSTRQDVRANLTALFEHDDGKLGIKLLEPDGCGQSCRPCADDDHIVFHAASTVLTLT